MKRRVRVLRKAQNDVAEIARYLACDVPATSLRLIDALLEVMEGLSNFPNRGARPRDEHLRKRGYRFVVQGQYLIFYRVLGAEVRIYRVVHGKRSYESWL